MTSPLHESESLFRWKVDVRRNSLHHARVKDNHVKAYETNTSVGDTVDMVCSARLTFHHPGRASERETGRDREGLGEG